jgi:hypothetical protein
MPMLESPSRGFLFANVNRHYIRVTFIWVCGLVIFVSLAIFWLGSLVLAIFKISRAHGANEVGGYVFIFLPILVVLGIAFRWFVNRFYDWWLGVRVNSLVDNYQSGVSLEFTETFKRQLRSSPTFQKTLIEAKKLAEELAAFSAISHTDEEWNTFRKRWQAKSERFATEVAEGDPLAVEVILKAIEKESEK